MPPLLISLQPGAGLKWPGRICLRGGCQAADVEGNTQTITAPQVIATLTFGPGPLSSFQLTFTRPNENTLFATYAFTPRPAAWPTIPWVVRGP